MAFQLTSAEAMARGIVDCAHSSVSVSLDGRPSKRPSRGPPAPSGHSFNGISAIPAEVWEVIFEHCAANDPPEVGEGHKKEGWGAIRRACRRFRWIVDNDPHIPALTCTQLPSIVDRVEGRIGEVPCSYILSPQIPRLRFARHINSDSDKARCSLLLNSSLVTKASTVVLEGRGDIAGHLRKLYSMAGGPRKLRELKVSLAKGASSVVRQVPPIHISRHVNDGRNRELSELGQGLGLHAEGLRELVLGTCLLKTAFTPNLTLLVLSWNSKLCVPRPTMREIKDAILSHCALSIEILVLENCPQFMTFTESSGGALELPRLRKLEITRTTSIVTTQVLSGIRFPAETRLKFAVEVTGSSNLQCVMGSIIMLLEGIGRRYPQSFRITYRSGHAPRSYVYTMVGWKDAEKVEAMTEGYDRAELQLCIAFSALTIPIFSALLVSTLSEIGSDRIQVLELDLDGRLTPLRPKIASVVLREVPSVTFLHVNDTSQSF